MGSKVHSIAQAQDKVVSARRNQFNSNWEQIKSPRIKQAFYQQNKEAIDTHRALSAEADKIREGFVDKEIEETAYKYIPASLDNGTYSRQKFWEKEGYVQERAIKNAKRAGEKINAYPYKVKKTDVFDFEDYKREYTNLRGDIKPYFAKPEDIKKKEEENRLNNKTKIQQEIDIAKQKLAEKQKYYADKIEKKKQWWSSKPSSYRHNPKNKENYKEDLNDYEDKLEEKEAFYQGYINKLNWGVGQVSSGLNYSFNQVRDFAYDYGDYRERREEARNEARELKKKFAGKIEEVKNSANWQEYAKNYSQLPKAIKNMFTAPASKQMKNFFNQKAEYESFAKQGLKPIYSGGKLAGFEDAVLGMSYSLDNYNSTFKNQRGNFNISFNPSTNRVKWEKNVPTSTPSKFNTQEIKMTPEQRKQFEQMDFDIKMSNYQKTVNPVHETYNPEVIISPEELEWWKMRMAQAYNQEVRKGETKTFSQKVGDFIPLDVNIPTGIDYGNVYQNIKNRNLDENIFHIYNPYKTEQSLIKAKAETSKGQIKEKANEIMTKWGDKYGEVNPQNIPKDKVDEFNADVEKYNELRQKDYDLKWYQGMGDRLKYAGLTGAQLVNPESVGELGVEAGVALGAYYGGPAVLQGLGQFSASYPLLSKGIEAGFFAKNVYDAQKGFRTHDWDKATSGTVFATLQTVPYAINAIKSIKYKGMQKSPTTVAEFEAEKKALEKAYSSMKGTPRELGNLRLDRVKEIKNSKKAHETIKNFIKNKDLTVGGTTGIETLKTSKGQVTLTRQPRDLELFVKAGQWNKNQLARELADDLTRAGYKVHAYKGAVIFDDIGGHGVNFQAYDGLNLNRYTGKIYTNPEGIKVADPIGISYNKVFDLLKRTRASGSKAQQLLKENPEAYKLGKYKGFVYVRYPKDSTGALDTAKQVLQTQIDDFTNFGKHNIPLHQEWQLNKYLREQQRLKPYFPKLASEEAKIIPYYYQGKPPSYFSGFKDPRFISSTMDRLRRIGDVSSGPMFMVAGGVPVPTNFYNQYKSSPYTSYNMWDNKYPIYATGIYKDDPSFTPYTSSTSEQTEAPAVYTSGEDTVEKYPTVTSEPTGYPSYTGYPSNPAFTFYPAMPTITYEYEEQQKSQAKTGGDPEFEVSAYQPIYYDENGNMFEGKLYPNEIEATAEGVDVTDKTPINKFNVKKVVARRELLSRHMGTQAGYKFKRRGSVYIEKVPYRKDKGGEKGGNFNIMPYVFNSR